MMWVSKSPHSSRGQQGQTGRYLNRQISAGVGKGHIGICSARGIEWYRPRCVRIPIEVSRAQEKKADTSTGRCSLGSRRILLELSEGGGLNSRGL